MKKFFATAVLMAVSLVGSAFAGGVTFTGINENKAFSYTNSGTNAFTVSGLSIGSVNIGGTDYAVTGGSLGVTSGARTGSTAILGGAIVNFAPGGSITITGAVPTHGVASNTTLLSGTFGATSAVLSSVIGGSFGGGFTVTYLNPYLFSGTILSAADAQTILQIAFNGTTGFSGTIQTSSVTLVPEPGSLALLGFGTLALPWSLRKYLVRR